MNELCELVFLLDRSGSMSGLEEDTIGGYNEFLRKQEKKEDVRVSTILFDNQYEVLFDAVKTEKAKLTSKDYYVRGMTALLDAIGKTILNVTKRHLKTKKEDIPSQVIFVITTDGMENASKEFSYQQINQMVSNKKEMDGWEFIFLGANIDSLQEGAKLGVSAKYARDYKATTKGTSEMYDSAFCMASEIRSERLSKKDNPSN